MIRLLIADDEALERETLADIVARRFEHEVTIETAENGRKAADTAVLWGADLILMDIEMPGMNGLDAARAVLEQRPECKVIFVTAYSLFQYAHEAMHLGACDYLLKPVNPDEVEASIRKAIRQIEAGRRLAELAPVEPEPEADPESDAAEAGENDRNALVMAHVRKYMEDNYDYTMTVFRPPMGEFSEFSLGVTANCGYETELWSFAYADWDVNNQPDEGQALEKLVNAAHPGAIYLLHSVSKTNTDILGDFIDRVRAGGFEFG